MGLRHYEDDSDLEPTLDRVFGDFDPMYRQSFSPSIPHRVWMGHVLLYRAWDVLNKGEQLHDDVKEFALHPLRVEPPPPIHIAADCLLIIGLILGIKLHIGDPLVINKR